LTPCEQTAASSADPGENDRQEQTRADRLVVHVANATAWLFPLLIIAINAQVFMRKAGHNQAWLDDAQWWMYGFAMTVGFAYAITTQSHVRVDVLHANFSDKKKARIEIFALGWLLLPFLAVMCDILFHYSWTSFLAREGSDSPNGLHRLYLLKLSLPLLFLLAMVATVSMVTLAAMGQVMDLNHWLVLGMFLGFIFLLFRGIPVAFALVGISLIFIVLGEFLLDPNKGWINEHIEYDSVRLTYKRLAASGGRFFGGTIKNPVLVALPMFIFMGLMLDRSGMAQRMMKSMQVVFGLLRGGLALSVMLIGIILAASTGVIGASVVLLGVMGIPTMLAQDYESPIAAGTVAASGTLGILIPPSIMLVIMSDQLAISLGDLFMGALFPGLLLGALYIGILLVLGSIFFGLATPTEASGLGALGATLIALFSGRLNFGVLKEVMRHTLNTCGYIVGIFITAAFFAFVLRRYGGDEIIEEMVLGSFDNPYLVVAFILFVIFCLGFLLDWIEITLIIMPLMLPVVLALDLAVNGYGVVSDPAIVWFAILVAVTLQTSFLTPPVGFALFYLKGVCPPEVKLTHIYRGVIPFVLLQLVGLGIVFAFPSLTTWLPAVAYGN